MVAAAARQTAVEQGGTVVEGAGNSPHSGDGGVQNDSGWSSDSSK